MLAKMHYYLIFMGFDYKKKNIEYCQTSSYKQQDIV